MTQEELDQLRQLGLLPPEQLAGASASDVKAALASVATPQVQIGISTPSRLTSGRPSDVSLYRQPYTDYQYDSSGNLTLRPDAQEIPADTQIPDLSQYGFKVARAGGQ